MPDPREDARKQYSKTRAEFEKLETQDKTVFVVEATFATLGQAVEETGRQFADVLERVANLDFGWNSPAWGSDAATPNPAAPPTSATKSTSRRATTDDDEA